MKELPTGTQSFDMIRSADMVYVDKTAIIYRMIKSGRQNFISRPRRFGKSLLVSTLESLFSKGTEMFKGLAIEKLWTDRTYRVLHFDFSGIPCDSLENFQKAAVRKFFRVAVKCGALDKTSSPDNFTDIADLMNEITSNADIDSTVLLIDEYDSPLNDNLNNPELFNKIHAAIRYFYAAVKEGSGVFHFIFVTGVSRFNKVSLFSVGSSIADITLSPEYGTLLGYTEDEIKTYFGEHLRAAAAAIFHVSSDKVTEGQLSLVMDELRRHYDGYCFDKKASTHVYQPWSVLQFLNPYRTYEFSDYWFKDSGVSTLVSNFIQLIGGVTADDRKTHSLDLDNLEINIDLNSSANRLAVLTQCGYFTIKKSDGGFAYVGLPNLELLHAWAHLLTGEMRSRSAAPQSDIDHLNSIGKSLFAKDVSTEAICDLFNSIYKVINSSNSIDTEYDACDIPVLYCLGTGYDVRTEVPEKGGRADITFEFADRRIVIEMKCARDGDVAEKKLDEAKAQIESRDCGKYAPLKKLRRFAMVFSVPEQKIVLAAEVKD